MAQRNQKIFDFVKQELSKNADLGSRNLYEQAKQADKSISGDSMQQFHARYVLPAKRELGTSSSGKRKAKQAPQKAGRRARGTTAAAEGREQPSTEAPRQRGRPRTQQPSGGSASRDQIRSLLLKFAQELTDAESRSGLVQVLGRVDDYVDRIAAAR